MEDSAKGGQTWRGERKQNQLYKPFLRGALATVLTAGCTLGAANLVVMALSADLGAVWTATIQAHAYAQIFGWVGLFIMGIAYHIVPRFYLRPLTHPELVLPSFVLAASGVALRAFSQPFAENPVAAWLMVISAALGLAGMTLFTWAMYDTMRHGEDRFGSSAGKLFMAAGFACLWLTSIATLALVGWIAARGSAAIPTSLDVPYLRLALSGAIVTLVLGFTLRTVPHMLGVPLRYPVLLKGVLALYMVAVVTQVAHDAAWLPGTWASTLGAGAEVAALLTFVYALGLYSLRRVGARALSVKNPWPERFVRTAYFWLLVASSLNFAYSLSSLAGRPAPHAFVAGYHHALTVGFISMMIVGMSMRLVPVFIGAMNKQSRLAGIVFTLILTGNTARITGQVLASLYGGGWYVVMGLSGVIEVCGLALYGWALWRALDRASYGQETQAGSLRWQVANFLKPQGSADRP